MSQISYKELKKPLLEKSCTRLAQLKTTNIYFPKNALTRDNSNNFLTDCFIIAYETEKFIGIS